MNILTRSIIFRIIGEIEGASLAVEWTKEHEDKAVISSKWLKEIATRLLAAVKEENIGE